MTAVLIKFSHGLGDCVQLTVVLQHLLAHHPDWQIDVHVVDSGKASLFQGFPRTRGISHDADYAPHYDRVYDLDWWEADAVERNQVPATKAEQCLRRVFGIEPRADLCCYRIPALSEPDEDVDAFMAGIAGHKLDAGRYPVVVLHYEGNTASEQKNLTHDLAARICREVIARGYLPVILDWDWRSPLPDDLSIHCPHSQHPLWRGRGTGDAVRIARLIEASSLFIGIDSGPQKIAATTSTPMICIWRQLHPIHYFPFNRATTSSNGRMPPTVHLVPEYHPSLMRGDRQVGLDLFEKYAAVVYQEEDLASQLVEAIQEGLPLRTREESPLPRVSVGRWREVMPTRHWRYRRIGVDERVLEFTDSRVAANYRIGEGAADRERVWNFEATSRGAVLTVWGDHGGPTLHAVWSGDRFQGRWLCCERCAVELVPDRPLELVDEMPLLMTERPIEPFFVGIPTYNRYDLCRNLLESVFRSTAIPEVVYVIDNGESEERFGYPDPRVSVFRPGRNLGVARSWNLLHRFAAPHPIVILNDDVELGRNCLERLVRSSSNAVTLNAHRAYEAFLMREEVWKTIGEFDEEFFPAYCEDNDHARRLDLAGFTIDCPLNDGVIQFGPSATRAKLPPHVQQALDGYAQRNRDYYRKKWGGPPHQEVYDIPFGQT
jgi:hypothetical protein